MTKRPKCGIAGCDRESHADVPICPRHRHSITTWMRRNLEQHGYVYLPEVENYLKKRGRM